MTGFKENIGYEQLIDFINGNASVDMQKRIALWLNEDVKNQKLYNELKTYYEKKGDLSNVRFDTERALKKVKSRLIRRKIISWYSVAAVLLFIVSFSLFIKFSINTEEVEIILVENTQAKVLRYVLPDNSIAWIDSNSHISYNKEFEGETRKIDMKGHVYFSVTKDKTKPFEILASNVYIKVLGTSFDVNEMNGETDLSVNSGSVLFAEKENIENNHIIEKNNKAIFVASTKLIKSTILEDRNFKSWFTGVISFKDRPVDDVCEYLSMYYKRKIKLKNPQDSVKRLTTVIDNLTVEEVKSTIEFALEIELEIK